MNAPRSGYPIISLAMITALSLTMLLLFGQGASFAVEDGDKRSFGELAPIYLDVDGDGRDDTIRPRTFVGRPPRQSSRREPGVRRTHWITFDLHVATGAERRAFFTYRYGDERADYWVWALKSAGDLNRDGRIDLVFYSGDDTTDETVVLLQEPSGFKASSSGHILCDACVIDSNYSVVALGQYDVKANRETPSRIVARWSPRREYFEGDGLYWVRSGRAPLRETPSASGRVVEWFHRDDAVAARLESGRPVTKGRWVMVETGLGTGWMDRGSLVSTSQWVTPSP